MIQRSILVRRLLAGFFLSLLSAVPGSAQPAFQVADVATGSPTPPQSPFGDSFAELDGTVFFFVDDGIHGRELWKTDGTEAGTTLVKDLCLGICSAGIHQLLTIGDRVYVATELLGVWRSDGTATGTIQIADIPARDMEELNGQLLIIGASLWSSDGTPGGIILLRDLDGGAVFQGKAGGLLFFAANNSPDGWELWKTDGTEAGTAFVKDIYPGSQSSLDLISRRFPAIGNRLFFRARSVSSDYEIWVTDGTATGTQRVSAQYPLDLIALGSELLFLANGLWKTDGTAAGTTQLTAQVGGFSGELTRAGNRVFFRGGGHNGDVLDVEPWMSDGTAAGTQRVADIRPGGSGHSIDHPSLYTALGNRMLFFANNGIIGEEPWVTDGTSAGTVPLGDLNPGSAGSYHWGSGFRSDRGIVAEGRWFFPAYTAPEGWALWATDGTPAGTRLVRRFPVVQSSLVATLLGDHEGTLFFGAREGSGSVGAGLALWRTDGSAAGTIRLRLLSNTTYANPEIFSWNGHLHYRNDLLWRSDGTAAGTQVFVSTPGGVFQSPSFFTPAAPGLFYINFNELWVSDGTFSGPERLLASSSQSLGRPVAFRDGIAFRNPNLWRSDGTIAGTAPVETTALLERDQFIRVAGDTLFFWAQVSGVTGYEPWASDGTAAGTRLLRDIRPGSGNSMTRPVNTVSFRNLWFFLADDGISGEELWVSDGTAPGTRRVRDIRPGPEPSAIGTLVAGRDRIWFTADDGIHGGELWMSDGTEAGTRMVRDALLGAEASLPRELAAIGHILLFSAFDPDHGIELWRSDGTEAGTFRLQDIAPGALSSEPSRFTASGPYVYFAANDGITGFEPWALDRTLLGGFLTATKKVSGQPFPGATLTYTIVLSNVGAGPHPDRPGDELVDILPAGLSLVSAIADVGTVTTNLPANRVAWNGALPAGGTATVTIEATVTASRGTVLRNQATLSFDANGDGVSESAGVSDVTDILIVSGPLDFYTLPPCRVFDTRSGAPLTSGVVRTFAVAGTCGIPADAEAVAANLTVITPSASGNVAVWPASSPAPGTSNINFAAGVTRANNATLALSSAGAIDVRASLAGSGQQTHLVLDVSGYYRPDPADE